MGKRQLFTEALVKSLIYETLRDYNSHMYKFIYCDFFL